MGSTWAIARTGNRFEGNVIEGVRRWGWPVWNAWDNVWVGNTITRTYASFSVDRTASGNLLYRNNASTQQPPNDHGQGNRWDNGGEGNYWADYRGRDANGNGIGDTPYSIVERNADRYPLMQPYRWVLMTQRRYLPLLLRRASAQDGTDQS